MASNPRPYVTLVSSDGHRFILPHSAAMGSGFLKSTLTNDFEEQRSGVVTLSEMRAEILELVAAYLMYKERYTDSREDVPDFQDRVKPEFALELLMASDFMEC